MTRSFGDLNGRNLGVTWKPGYSFYLHINFLEIKEFTINYKDKFIILATDGLWKVLSN